MPGQAYPPGQSVQIIAYPRANWPALHSTGDTDGSLQEYPAGHA